MRTSTYLFFAALCAAVVFISHAALLEMPYFWDEVGASIPQAQTIYSGHLPEGPPPLVAAWVATAWRALHSSEVVTRCAMLLLASAALMAVFLLAIELCGSLPGVPALFVVIFMAASPLFYTQGMLAQNAMPAMLCAVPALWYFLRDNHLAAAAFCIPLVLLSPAGFTLPLVLAGWLVFERRAGSAAWYVAPLAMLVLNRPHFDLLTHPAQVAIALARRLHFLFISDGHWLAALGVFLAWYRGLLNRRRWKVVGVFSLVFLLFSIVSKPLLDRDVLLMLPLLYTAGVAGFHTMVSRWKLALSGALLACLLAGMFINPPLWPFPYENNLAMTDFTALQEMTASYLEREAHGKTIATAWPLSAELKRPELGYVDRRLTVLLLADFAPETITALPKDTVDVFVRYSRDWDPPRSLLQHRAVRYAARHYFGFKPMVDPGEIEHTLGLKLTAAWQRRGQWVEIYAK